MKKLLLTLLTFLIAVNVAYPQLAIRHRLATPRPADSLDIDYSFKLPLPHSMK